MKKFDVAIIQLDISRDVLRTNAPINEREGNHAQAKLERTNAIDYTAAINQLKTDKVTERRQQLNKRPFTLLP